MMAHLHFTALVFFSLHVSSTLAAALPPLWTLSNRAIAPVIVRAETRATPFFDSSAVHARRGDGRVQDAAPQSELRAEYTTTDRGDRLTEANLRKFTEAQKAIASGQKQMPSVSAGTGKHEQEQELKDAMRLVNLIKEQQRLYPIRSQGQVPARTSSIAEGTNAHGKWVVATSTATRHAQGENDDSWDHLKDGFAIFQDSRFTMHTNKYSRKYPLVWEAVIWPVLGKPGQELESQPTSPDALKQFGSALGQFWNHARNHLNPTERIELAQRVLEAFSPYPRKLRRRPDLYSRKFAAAVDTVLDNEKRTTIYLRANMVVDAAIKELESLMLRTA